MYLFIYSFRQCWVSAAQCELFCGEWGCSLVCCRGLALKWLVLRRSTGSRAAGFSSCGSWAPENRLDSCGARHSCFSACGMLLMLLNCGVGGLLRVPWTARRSNQSILKEISPGFVGRPDAEAEAPILWPPDVKNWVTGKDPDAGKDWRWEETGTTEDEMVGWHHRLSGHEFEQAPGFGDGQGGLACCSPWGRSRTRLSGWTELMWDLPRSGIKPVFLALAGAFFTTESFFTREALNFLLSPELFVILLLPAT